MDKNVQNLKMEELRAAMHNRDFQKAAEIADSMDLKKMRDNNFLCLVADAYEVTHRYEDAKKVLLAAYENTNAGRHLAYRLCLIAVKTKEYDEAEEFYEDFVEMAPRDTSRYILKYKMAKAKGAPVEKLIDIMEEYVNIDMEEKWAYELAKLYHMAGDEEKCVDMCDEISLWFAEGKYVIKAMELKRKYVPLTKSQLEKYEEGKKKHIEEMAKKEAEKIAESLKPFDEEQSSAEIEPDKKETDINHEESNSEPEFNEIKELDEVVDIDEIKIKPAGQDKFNTMDIQAVIAEGMKEAGIVEEVNIHEGEGATKVAPDFTGKNRQEEQPYESEEQPEKSEDKSYESEEQHEESEEHPEESEEKSQETEDDFREHSDDSQLENVVDETEPIKDIKGVKDILRQLQARGILKAETVQQAVNIIDEAGGTSQVQKEETAETIEESVPEESDEQWEQEEEPEVKAKEEQEEESEVKVEDEQYEEPISDDQPLPIEETESHSQSAKAEDVNKDSENGLHTQKELSAKIEIISGTDWKQPETEPVKEEQVKKEEIPNTQDINLKDEKGLEESSEAPSEESKVVLTEEELTTFKNYLNVEGLATNIREVLTDLVENYNPNGKSSDGNVIIMGDEKTGKTTLAIEIIKLVNKKRGRNRKLAKIDASALNKRGFRNSLNKLLGSDLIVENAHNLGVMTLSEVLDVSGMFTDDMLIVLEGETAKMEIMMKNSPRIKDVFNHIITIKEYDIKEWVQYGMNYAKEQGYGMDELANLAFYKSIDDYFGTHKGIGQQEVENIVDNAIGRSGRLGRKLSGIFSSNKEEEGLKMLVESDFNN